MHSGFGSHLPGVASFTSEATDIEAGPARPWTGLGRAIIALGPFLPPLESATIIVSGKSFLILKKLIRMNTVSWVNVCFIITVCFDAVLRQIVYAFHVVNIFHQIIYFLFAWRL